MKLTLPRLICFHVATDIVVAIAFAGTSWAGKALGWLIALQVLSIPALVVVYGVWMFAERKRKLQEFAKAHDLRAVAADDAGIVDSVRRCDTFTRDNARLDGDVLLRTQGDAELAIFDCQVSLHKPGKRGGRAVVALQSAAMDLPLMSIFPTESKVRKRRAPQPGRTNVALSETHALDTEDAATVELFDAEALSILQQQPDMCVEGCGDVLLVFQDGRLSDADEVARFTELALALANCFAARNAPALCPQ